MNSIKRSSHGSEKERSISPPHRGLRQRRGGRGPVGRAGRFCQGCLGWRALPGAALKGRQVRRLGAGGQHIMSPSTAKRPTRASPAISA